MGPTQLLPWPTQKQGKRGKQLLTLEFVRGLIDGDGSFNVSFLTTRRRINVNFTVVCELSSISVLNDLVDFFSCGTVYKLQSNAARYQVQKCRRYVR